MALRTSSFLLVSSVAFAQSTHFVAPDGLCPSPGGGSGTSADPFHRIQDAIAISSAGDTVQVAPGTYCETIDFLGLAITVSGVAGQTIIDAQSNGPVVTFASGETNASILENVTLTGGRANEGGGVYCESSGPLIRDCIIENNCSTGSGGGLFSRNEAPDLDRLKVVRTLIYNNFASTLGGGVAVLGESDPSQPCFDNLALFRQCEIRFNGSKFGGGVSLGGHCVDPEFRKCKIDNNFADDTNCDDPVGGGFSLGGGIAIDNGPAGTFKDCSISRNLTLGSGGGLYYDNLAGTSFVHCSFVGNRAEEHGGGVHGLSELLAPSFENCLLASNTAGSGSFAGIGGAMDLRNTAPLISHCTVANNLAYGGSGGIQSTSAALVVSDSILWANRPSSAGDLVAAPTASVTFSDVRNGTGQPWFGNPAVTGNLDANPRFTTGYACPLAPFVDYFLDQGASPCVDQGSQPASTQVITGRSTDPADVVDSGQADMGFHYPRQLGC